MEHIKPEIPESVDSNEGEEVLDQEWVNRTREEAQNLLSPEHGVYADNEYVDGSMVLAFAEDERTPDELTPIEKNALNDALLQSVGIDSLGEDSESSPLVVDEYSYRTTVNPEGVAVRIYETVRKDEGVYLHILTFPDGGVEIVLAPQEFRFEDEVVDEGEVK